MICTLCIKHSNSFLNIFDNYGLQLGIADKIGRHFWFKPYPDDETSSKAICTKCWSKVFDFDQFYVEVEEAHSARTSYGVKKEYFTELLDNEFVDPDVSIKNEFVEIPCLLDEKTTDIEKEQRNPFCEIDSDKALSNEVYEKCEDSLNSETDKGTSDTAEISQNLEMKLDQCLFELKSLKKKEPSEIQKSTTFVMHNTRDAPKSKRKRLAWAEDGEVAILDLWAERVVDLRGVRKNGHIYAEMANELAKLGHKYSPRDVQVKLANFSQRYRKEKGGSTSTWPFYGRVHQIIGGFKPNTFGELTLESIDDASVMSFAIGQKSTSVNSKSTKSLNASTNRRKNISTKEIIVKSKVKRSMKTTHHNAEIVKKYIHMTCELCTFISDDFGTIKKHFRIIHSNIKPFVRCCNKKLFDRLEIADHAHRHEDPEFFKCQDCQKVFSDRYTLRSHRIAAHAPEEELIFECDQCPKKFSRKKSLDLHRPSHIPRNERSFICDQCPNSRFASNDLLKIHINMRHRRATNICHVCAKEIRDKAAYKKHVRLHFEDSGPRIKCTRPGCDSWLKDEENLRAHLRRHNEEGLVFNCDDCGRVCKNRQALRSHMNHVHSTEVFTCEECHKTFKNAISLREHMAQHTGESLYNCPFCTRTFNSNANMHSHKKKMHPVEWEIQRKAKQGNSQQLISNNMSFPQLTTGARGISKQPGNHFVMQTMGNRD